MSSENTKQPSPLAAQMVEDEATEKLKKRARYAGLIVNASVGKSPKQPVKKEGTKK